MTRVYTDNVIEALRELSDEAVQRRLWLASSGPEMSLFDEAVCGLFDDTGLGRALDRRECVFGKDIDDSLRTLDQLLKRIDRTLPPLVLIEDPKMQEVRNEASAILTAILDNDG